MLTQAHPFGSKTAKGQLRQVKITRKVIGMAQTDQCIRAR